MKVYEIFQNLDEALAHEIIGYFRTESRDIYKATVSSLATQRKLRAAYVQKKPGADQIAWVVKTLKLKMADTVGEHLLQVWLLKQRKDMLIRFVDDLGIEHDDDGGVENLPETIEEDKLKAAIDHLLEDYPANVVTLYLRVFQIQQPGGWPAIAGALKTDERLELGRVGG
jgi:hypothetical protein